MPSYRVSKSATALDLSAFDVVGKDGTETDFIDHTGLAESAGKHEAHKVPVLDMGPPLHWQGDLAHMKASVVGSAALTDDEERKIQTFVDKHAGEHSSFSQLSQSELIRAAPQMYCIHPHSSPYREADGRVVRTRFSCAGFVFEAYKTARIRLLDPNALPMIDMVVIRSAYPGQARLMENDRVSPEALGLKGSGPWPVLLCGYLFHALDRDPNAIRKRPYKPDFADQRFN